MDSKLYSLTIQWSRLLLCIVLVVPNVGFSQQNMTDVEIKAQKMSDNLYMLTGRGGNLGLSVGEDGSFLIDDQYAPLTQKIMAKIDELTDKPVKFVVNTHLHGDHTGGNENFGKTGAYIVAHENVREFLSQTRTIERFGETQTIEARPEEGLPVITFSEDINFHWNSEHIHIFHVNPAHTNGDAVIYFKNANVVHTGDIFFNGFYPFFDTEHGGRFQGMIDAVNQIIGKIDKDTKIIPGHGPSASYEDMVAYRDMLQGVYDNMKPLVDSGKSLEEVKRAQPTERYDGEWGNGFLKPDVWVELIYNSMKNAHKH